MQTQATIALGAFAIIFFSAALIMGLFALKKYQAHKKHLEQSKKPTKDKKPR